MRPAQQREADFRRELAELLRKHGAEIQVTDDGRPYGLHSGICRVTMEGKYDKDGAVVEDYTEFDL